MKETGLLRERIRILRFWNSGVFKNAEGVLETIYNALSQTLSQRERDRQSASQGATEVISKVNGSKAMEEQIVETVVRFQQNEMSLNATSVSINLQAETLFVMLEGLTFPAEKACAKDEHGEELLEQYHARVYHASRSHLETEIASVLGRIVQRSALRVDPISGTGTMQFTLGDAADEGENEPE